MSTESPRSRPPPELPRAVGTKLYPREALPVGPVHTTAQLLREESLARQYNERCAFYRTKHPQWEDFRHYYGYERNMCSICSEFTSMQRRELMPVYHSHHSTMLYRIGATLDQWGHYFCPTCEGGFHAVKEGVRYPLLITSSTLSCWRGRLDLNNYPGDPIHLDEICIGGARIRDLRHAYQAEYDGLHRPVDVILVAGINNILEGQSPDRIMLEISEFHSEVRRNAGSSFAVCTLPFPPCLSILPEDQRHQLKRDATETLKELNTLIRNYNKGNADGTMDVSRAPCFHTWGLRSVRSNRSGVHGPRYLMELLPAHNPGSWREQQPRNQLHLADPVRLRMGKAILRYFKEIYSDMENLGESQSPGDMMCVDQ